MTHDPLKGFRGSGGGHVGGRRKDSGTLERGRGGEAQACGSGFVRVGERGWLGSDLLHWLERVRSRDGGGVGGFV